MTHTLRTRREWLGTMAAGWAGMQAPAPAGGEKRPNLLYILADDLGYGDPTCYNAESKTPTPAMDAFAKQGVRFTDAHSPSAVCTPTRYGILTGRYCWRSALKKGVLQGYSPSLIEPGRMTVASLLKSRGYETAAMGKWHLGFQNGEKVDYEKPLRPGPLDYGFDSYFGIPASLDMEPYVYVENDHVLEQPTGTVKEIREQRGIFYRGGAAAPGFRHEEVLPKLTARAAEWVKGRRQQPWFLYLPFTAPHTPWLPVGQFQGKSKAGPYGDFVTMVDDAMGQVLKALDESGQAQNTLVVITSDNGAHWLPEEIEKWGHRANDGWKGQKADIWDAGHRIPLLARWPGKIAAGTTSAKLTCLTDLMATMAEVTGGPLPAEAGEDSFSMLGTLTGRRTGSPEREAVVHHSASGHFAVRRGSWKLHLGRGSGGFSDPREYKPKPGEPAGELFNLATDPEERNNLYKRRPELVAELTALLEKYQREGRSRPA